MLSYSSYRQIFPVSVSLTLKIPSGGIHPSGGGGIFHHASGVVCYLGFCVQYLPCPNVLGCISVSDLVCECERFFDLLPTSIVSVVRADWKIPWSFFRMLRCGNWSSSPLPKVSLLAVVAFPCRSSLFLHYFHVMGYILCPRSFSDLRKICPKEILKLCLCRCNLAIEL